MHLRQGWFVFACVYQYHCSLCVQISGWTALHIASKEGHVEISRMLIEGGADLNMKDKVCSPEVSSGQLLN